MLRILTNTSLYLSLLCLFSYSTITAQETTGPESGSLVVVGGGRVGDDILLKFIELAGGMDAPLIVIPTAAGQESYDQDAGVAKDFRRLGAKNVSVLHTDDRKEADSKAFAKAIEKAGGVWFGGGRQWRLVDSYGGTRSEKAFWKVLDNGGAIGGSSAGATIQGSYLARGDTQNNQVMMGDHEIGFGFIKNIAIDQHVLARNRQFDLFTILDKKPELLGVGIDEGTAMIVQGNTFEVMGPSYVLVYDQSFWSREGSRLKQLPEDNRKFYFLRNGDRYDLVERKVVRE